jgi:Zn-dependent protease/CBS domain-containing protein
MLQYVLLGIITSFFFFASVLVHELSHSVVAVLHGIPVRRITLFLFGGIAEISREPSDPGTELKIALAGPATSAVLALTFWIVFVILSFRPERSALQLAFFYLAIANTFLLAFNLLPGLPLDGGRVLRALLWRSSGNVRRATYMASLTGKVIAAILIIAGLVAIVSRTYIITGVWFIFIALFLRQAAESSYRQVVLTQTLGDASVRDVMTSNVVEVEARTTIQDLVDVFFLHHHFICYPIVQDGKAAGYVTIKDVKNVPRERWQETLVTDVMTPVGPNTSLSPDDDIPSAMRRMAASGCGRLPVIENGRLVGIVTRRDIMNYIEIRSDLGDEPQAKRPHS